MLPVDFPPVSTVRGYFYRWRDNGLLETINQLLVMAAREIEGKRKHPASAAG
jgi:putative transposase